MFFYRKHNDYTLPETGIDEIVAVSVGGFEQSLLIQAENPSNPVLLFLHGGPSMPLPGVSCRHADYALAVCTKQLVKHFVVVFWDQRGTGKSYHKNIPQDSMTLEQFISDANEVTDYLRARFQQEKIYLAAHSWGTTVGLHLAARHPNKFHAYTAFSQIVSWTENDRLAYRWVLEQAKAEQDQRAIKELTALGEPPYTESFQQWGTLRKWLVMKYKSMMHDTGDALSPSFFKALKIMFRSHDYSVRDVFRTLGPGFRRSYSDQMIADLTANNFFDEVPRIDVPVYFIHGRQETHVFPELTTAYFDKLEAPRGKQFFWLEKSSHMYHPDDARVAEGLLITEVLGMK